ncbi:uncharacterized protein LOC127751712 isoform X1 [Frankliniella occidentalis]|uniref:Uncharacterized protein LOC127751712 isoform X1 n=1 Tax=Frankliniella occidentalis TaxID=133901 RepID=A0A9C6X9Q5_FRAOC|nr:uncharacterized protein LOC127751712 isoform X1 [Frankliniella occidentalis]
MLIASYHAFKSLFDDDLHRSDEVYADISKKLKKFGCNASAEDCSKRMVFLAKKYKEIEDMRLLCSGTGDVTNWIYYDAMSQIFEKSRVMKPQKLLAAGTASVSKSRNDDDEEEEEDQNNDGSSCRGRKKKTKKKTNSYTSALPIQSYKERKLQQGNELRTILANLAENIIAQSKQ